MQWLLCKVLFLLLTPLCVQIRVAAVFGNAKHTDFAFHTSLVMRVSLGAYCGVVAQKAGSQDLQHCPVTRAARSRHAADLTRQLEGRILGHCFFFFRVRAEMF